LRWEVGQGRIAAGLGLRGWDFYVSAAMRAGDLLTSEFRFNLEHSAAKRAAKLHRGHGMDNPREVKRTYLS